ncbi:MAG TPA: VOC family protein, partial [Candidatus Jeotgalibaca pullicola]|nr:VOC family protein [Candidatus Jeotgalibaca pullicola]
MKPLIGIHHITAITSSAEKNYEFFTNILSMRLVKKTIN